MIFIKEGTIWKGIKNINIEIGATGMIKLKKLEQRAGINYRNLSKGKV